MANLGTGVLRLAPRPGASPTRRLGRSAQRPRSSESGRVVGAPGGRTSSSPALTLSRSSSAKRSRICRRREAWT